MRHKEAQKRAPDSTEAGGPRGLRKKPAELSQPPVPSQNVRIVQGRPLPLHRARTGPGRRLLRIPEETRTPGNGPRHVLRSAGNRHVRVPARQRYRIPGPEAGKPTHLRRRVPQADRLRIRQDRGVQDVHALWNPGVYRPRNTAKQGTRKGSRLVDARDPDIRNARGIPAVLRRGPRGNIQKNPRLQTQVSELLRRVSLGHTHRDARELTKNLLAYDPTKRFGNLHKGIDDIKNCNWFSNIDFKRLVNKEIDAPYVPVSVPSNTQKIAEIKARADYRDSIRKPKAVTGADDPFSDW